MSYNDYKNDKNKGITIFKNFKNNCIITDVHNYKFKCAY